MSTTRGKVSLLLVALASVVVAQPADLFSHVEGVPRSRSIPLSTNGSQVFSASARDAVWVRAEFVPVDLPIGAELRVRSLKDGAEQRLTHESMQQWVYRTAYFNGAAIEVQLMRGTAKTEPVVTVSTLIVGESPPLEKRSLCGPDDRVRANRPKDARLLFSDLVCSAWMIADAHGCFLTAGHCCGLCTDGVFEFNVPPSTSTGGLQHPAPEFQFPVDRSSNQGESGGVGDDWRYLGTYANSNTGRSPRATMGALGYTLANSSQAPPSGSVLQAYGHGTSANNVENMVVKGTVGPQFSGPSRGALDYRVSTTGGDSGSAVTRPGTLSGDSDGVAVAIHTHGGCSSTGAPSYYNSGTYIASHNRLQNGLANPRGICLTGY